MPGSPAHRNTVSSRAARLLLRRVVLPIVDRRDWIAAHAVVLVLLAVGVLVAVGCTAVVAEVYDAVEDGDDLARLDHPALETAQSWRSPARNDLVTAFTDLGGTIGLPVVAVVLLGLLALLRRRWEPLLLGLIAVPVALAMSMVGKSIVGRVRPPRSAAVPPYESSPSFPSGHALVTTTVMALVAYLALRYLHHAWQRVLTLLACGAYALAMGLSRVFLGHHWLSDVAAGWALGVGWVVGLATLHQAWLLVADDPPRRRPSSAPD